MLLEVIAGHHYQISFHQENGQLPRFARFLLYGAYREGWALYCESMGKELGLYTEPKQRIGALGEKHQAIRWVRQIRGRMKAKFFSRFSLPRFHDAILRNGGCISTFRRRDSIK